MSLNKHSLLQSVRLTVDQKCSENVAFERTSRPAPLILFKTHAAMDNIKLR